MRRLVVGLVLAAVGITARMPAARAEVTAEAVRDAIQRGAAYLKRQQRPDGSWFEPAVYMGQQGGITALCTLALLNAGVEPDDDSIRRALAYLHNPAKTAKRTYVVSLQIMVFCRAEPETGKLKIRELVQWLESTQVRAGDYRGGWSYPGLGAADNSNSQFAILALHEAERIGVPVRPETWKLAQGYWQRGQNKDGSWPYVNNPSAGIVADAAFGGTGSMTCAGITSLVIANDMVEPPDARVEGDRILCCQPHAGRDEPVQRGIQWLTDHFSVIQNPGRAQMWHLYYMYGLERVGRMTNRRFFGDHDWYREGTERLLTMKGGALADNWVGADRNESYEALATSFALLFLSKGRWPVLMSKLKHGNTGDWEAHRHDVANLTHYTELKWKRDLIWQVIDLPSATVDDLTPSPVLYLCGSDTPLPEDPKALENLAQKLRGYLDRGGFLLAEGYCGGAAFDAGFRKLMELVFPEPEYRLQKLDPGHPVWHAEETIPPECMRNLPPLLGIEFGCRTSVVYAPDTQEESRRPLSCFWELSRPGRETKYPPAVQKQIDAGMSLGINILAYATNRELQGNEVRLDTAKKRPAGDASRVTLYVPNLLHPGGCNSAPRALANLLQSAADNLKLRVGVEPREVKITDAELFDYHMVFVQGRTRFTLTDGERKQLRTFLQRGGMIFANAICASQPFAESFRHEMQLILPEQPLKPIPKGDPLLTTEFGGFDLSTVSRRDPRSGGGDQPLRAVVRQVPPELEAITLGKHYAVIFSPYDLSCALEKQETMECQGYTRQDAARIGLNVLLYSLQK